MLQYRFTWENGAYVVTTPAAADAWRKLDGDITTHARGAVACVQLHGADALLVEDVREAWRAWWQSVYC